MKVSFHDFKTQNSEVLDQVPRVDHQLKICLLLRNAKFKETKKFVIGASYHIVEHESISRSALFKKAMNQLKCQKLFDLAVFTPCQYDKDTFIMI